MSDTNAGRVIAETDNFLLVLGKGIYESPWQGQLCYQIYNREFMVCEAEGPMEVSARAALQDFQAQYEQFVGSAVEVPNG